MQPSIKRIFKLAFLVDLVYNYFIHKSKRFTRANQIYISGLDNKRFSLPDRSYKNIKVTVNCGKPLRAIKWTWRMLSPNCLTHEPDIACDRLLFPFVHNLFWWTQWIKIWLAFPDRIFYYLILIPCYLLLRAKGTNYNYIIISLQINISFKVLHTSFEIIQWDTINLLLSH